MRSQGQPTRGGGVLRHAKMQELWCFCIHTPLRRSAELGTISYAMSKWAASIRGKDGQLETVVIEAESKAEVFTELKKRGINSVVRVDQTDGKIKPRKAASAKSGGKSPSLVKGIIAGVVVVAGALAVWYFLSPEQEKAPEQAVEETTKVIPDAAKPIPKRTAETVPEKPKEIPYWKRDTTNGLNEAQLRKWKHAHRPPPGYTNTTSLTEAPPSYAIFEHSSENTIAGYLTMNPGETLVGTPHYGKRFTQDFLKSLETPIIVTKDDTPEQAELKRLMIDTKIELKARYDEGEDIGKILEETHAEYQRLAAVKADIQKEFNEFRKNPDATVEDVELFLEAANKLLEQKGVSPIKLSPIAKRMMMRRQGVTK